MKRVAEREGRADELLGRPGRRGRGAGPQAAPAYLQIAKVYERLGRKDDALAALLAARRVSPNEPLVLSELAGIYETQGRYEELADVLLAWVGSINDESELVAINLRLAALYEEDLKRDAGRHRALPGHPRAHPRPRRRARGPGQALLPACRTGRAWSSVFDAEIAAAEDAQAEGRAACTRRPRCSRSGWAGRRRPSRATTHCLQLQPGYLPAQKALVRLYEQPGPLRRAGGACTSRICSRPPTAISSSPR